jgi:hypothetical protein
MVHPGIGQAPAWKIQSPEFSQALEDNPRWIVGEKRPAMSILNFVEDFKAF